MDQLLNGLKGGGEVVGVADCGEAVAQLSQCLCQS